MRSATTARETASNGGSIAKLVAAQARVGAPNGMDGPIVKLRRPRVGGRTFTLLDDLANDRANRG